MGLRTVRLDDDAERLLSCIRQATGLPISAAFKKGLEVLHRELGRIRSSSPFDVYQELDLGPGGYNTRVPSSETKKAVKAAIQRKLGR